MTQNNASDLLQALTVFRSLLNAFPARTFVLDADARILFHNDAAGNFFKIQGDEASLRPLGAVLRCVKATSEQDGWCTSANCTDCAIRDATLEAMRAGKMIRKNQRMQLGEVASNSNQGPHLVVTASPFAFQGQDLILLTLEDVGELVQLRGLLPICAHCKRVREEYWQSIEQYFQSHLDVDFSHSICDECRVKYYPQSKAKGSR